jgi:glycosyltransferase involved in cell wall biosynthesis
MKVLHIFNELKPSGGEAMMLSAAPIWIGKAEMHILSTGETVGIYANKLSAAGYIIHHIQFRKNVSFFLTFAKLLKSEKFEIVHIHTERASLWFALTAHLAAGGKIKLVRTVHHIFKFKGWLRLRKIFERFAIKSLLGATLISNSPSGKRNELNRFYSDNMLIPNWYDSRYYCEPSDEQRARSRAILNYKPSTCVFLSLGGNWAYKNYFMIVEAMAILPGNFDVLYVQVGVQGDESPLEALAQKLGVTDRVRCVGVVDDVLIYLNAADVYLMPSSEEGFGVAAVEAMACALPAILSDVEALCDFRGIIPCIDYIKPSPKEISDAMSRFANLTEYTRRQIGKNNSTAAKNNFGLEVGAAGYLDLYQKIS